MAASKGVFGLRCSRSWVNSCMVIGECLGHLDVAGATLVAPMSAALIVDHPCSIGCHLICAMHGCCKRSC